jgi:hypothetical protein
MADFCKHGDRTIGFLGRQRIFEKSGKYKIPKENPGSWNEAVNYQISNRQVGTVIMLIILSHGEGIAAKTSCCEAQ